MARKKENPPPPGAARPRRAAAARAGRRIVRKLAQGTLFAAGFAVTQLGGAEVDSRFKLFDQAHVDRLQAPITRYHE